MEGMRASGSEVAKDGEWDLVVVVMGWDWEAFFSRRSLAMCSSIAFGVEPWVGVSVGVVGLGGLIGTEEGESERGGERRREGT